MKNKLAIVSVLGVLFATGCKENEKAHKTSGDKSKSPSVIVPVEQPEIAPEPKTSLAARLGLGAAKCLGGLMAGALVGGPVSHFGGVALRKFTNNYDPEVNYAGYKPSKSSAGEGYYYVLGVTPKNDTNKISRGIVVAAKRFLPNAWNEMKTPEWKNKPWEVLTTSLAMLGGCVGAQFIR